MNIARFKSIGKIQYSDNWRLTLEVDRSIAYFYQKLIPKYIPSQLPRWAPHITIVRPEKEVPKYPRHWGKYNGKKVEFFYDNYIFNDEIYFWINAWSLKLEDIRNELGLPFYKPFTTPAYGYNKNFHITIANKKL